MERMFIGLVAAAALLIVGAAIFGGGGESNTAEERRGNGASAASTVLDTAPEAGEAPRIETVNAEGMARMLRAAEGTIVLVNLWATWCPPCREEMPELAEFHTAWKDKGVTFISLCANELGSVEEEVRPYVTETALPFPVYMMGDSLEKMEKSLKTYISGALPTTILYNPEGNMVKLHEGALTRATLEAWIEPYLKQVG